MAKVMQKLCQSSHQLFSPIHSAHTRSLQIQVEEPVVIGTSTAISTKDPHALLKIHDSAVPEQWLRYIAIGSHQSPILRLRWCKGLDSGNKDFVRHLLRTWTSATCMPQEVISHRFKLMSTLTSRSSMIDTNQMKKGHTETLLCAFCNCCTILKRYIGLHIEVVQIIQVTWLLGQVRDSVQYSSIFTFERGLPAQVALICSPLSGPCIHLIVEAQQVSHKKRWIPVLWLYFPSFPFAFITQVFVSFRLLVKRPVSPYPPKTHIWCDSDSTALWAKRGGGLLSTATSLQISASASLGFVV